ncbi:GyrI-like domain-containing protein [Actinokineospora xionganensis]|uniref:GyrI-like domain-containing protein n=1 Tax=Actinokineospora xionganensis TaxID=2684470 RepID=A0ABR7KZR4_9PSEU|nr:GyrI-like domain-containing protein [Actinokineospora xionganensis]MBC6445923.1 GyrI-like domain-containing protein [Actinokineospora xionganensis]
MSYAVNFKEVEPSTVLCSRMSVPADRVPEAVRSAVVDLAGRAYDIDLSTCGAPDVTYFNGFQPGRTVEIETSLPVIEKPGRHDSDILTRRPGGLVAHVFHKGPYDDIRDAYDALLIRVHDAGYDLAGHPTETYLIGPWDTAGTEDYLTEISVPVRKPAVG